VVVAEPTQSLHVEEDHCYVRDAGGRPLWKMQLLVLLAAVAVVTPCAYGQDSSFPFSANVLTQDGLTDGTVRFEAEVLKAATNAFVAVPYDHPGTGNCLYRVSSLSCPASSDERSFSASPLRMRVESDCATCMAHCGTCRTSKLRVRSPEVSLASIPYCYHPTVPL
jgi:hypothetical protein